MHTKVLICFIRLLCYLMFKNPNVLRIFMKLPKRRTDIDNVNLLRDALQNFNICYENVYESLKHMYLHNYT